MNSFPIKLVLKAIDETLLHIKEERVKRLNTFFESYSTPERRTWYGRTIPAIDKETVRSWFEDPNVKNPLCVGYFPYPVYAHSLAKWYKSKTIDRLIPLRDYIKAITVDDYVNLSLYQFDDFKEIYLKNLGL